VSDIRPNRRSPNIDSDLKKAGCETLLTPPAPARKVNQTGGLVVIISLPRSNLASHFKARTELVNRPAVMLRCGATKIGYFGTQRISA